MRELSFIARRLSKYCLAFQCVGWSSMTRELQSQCGWAVLTRLACLISLALSFSDWDAIRGPRLLWGFSPVDHIKSHYLPLFGRVLLLLKPPWHLVFANTSISSPLVMHLIEYFLREKVSDFFSFSIIFIYEFSADRSPAIVLIFPYISSSVYPLRQSHSPIARIPSKLFRPLRAQDQSWRHLQVALLLSHVTKVLHISCILLR